MRGFAVARGGVFGGEGADYRRDRLGLAGVFARVVEGARESRVSAAEVARELGETREVGVQQEVGREEPLELLANVGGRRGVAALRTSGVERAERLVELDADG